MILPPGARPLASAPVLTSTTPADRRPPALPVGAVLATGRRTAATPPPAGRPAPAGVVLGRRGPVRVAAGAGAGRRCAAARGGDGGALGRRACRPPVAAGRGRLTAGRGRRGPGETPRARERLRTTLAPAAWVVRIGTRRA